MVDPCFAYNFSEAQKCDISVGAYHFFSYDSPGVTQAENFIRTVEPFEGMLPPVVDVELYGEKKLRPPPREAVTEQLSLLLQRLGGGALWSWCSMGLCALFYALLLFLFARDEVRSLAAWLLPSRRGALEPPKNADAASNREGGASD